MATIGHVQHSQVGILLGALSSEDALAVLTAFGPRSLTWLDVLPGPLAEALAQKAALLRDTDYAALLPHILSLLVPRMDEQVLLTAYLAATRDGKISIRSSTTPARAAGLLRTVPQTTELIDEVSGEHGEAVFHAYLCHEGVTPEDAPLPTPPPQNVPHTPLPPLPYTEEVDDEHAHPGSSIEIPPSLSAHPSPEESSTTPSPTLPPPRLTSSRLLFYNPPLLLLTPSSTSYHTTLVSSTQRSVHTRAGGK